MSLQPYYQDDWATIYHGDYRDVIFEIEKSAVVIFDPPYGVNEEYKSYIDTQGNLTELISYLMPLVLSFSRAALTPGVGNIFKYPEPTWILCWAISGAGSTGRWGFSCWQPILVYGKDPYLASGNGRRPDLIYLNETSRPNGHPCPKPIGFMKRLIDRVSLAKEICFDPLMGSGTTLVAAKQLNRKSIGIEIEEKYCEIAANRLRQEVFDLTL